MQSQETQTGSTHNKCGCGKPAVKWSVGSFVCADCIERDRVCHEAKLLNDRHRHSTTVNGKKIPNPEYVKRYSKVYHANQHLPKEERCALARKAAATPLVVHEEQEREAALCECGYPAAYNETKCTVCLYLCHTLTRNNSVNSSASIA